SCLISDHKSFRLSILSFFHQIQNRLGFVILSENDCAAVLRDYSCLLVFHHSHIFRVSYTRWCRNISHSFFPHLFLSFFLHSTRYRLFYPLPVQDLPLHIVQGLSE